jgi:hypothetical protein
MSLFGSVQLCIVPGVTEISSSVFMLYAYSEYMEYNSVQFCTWYNCTVVLSTSYQMCFLQVVGFRCGPRSDWSSNCMTPSRVCRVNQPGSKIRRV